MAIATYTASAAAANAPVGYYATGLHHKRVTYVGSGNTLSDIIQLIKIPDQATIVDWYASMKSAEALVQVKLGVTGAETALGTITASASASVAFNARTIGFTPVKMSITDGVTPHHGFIYATLSAGSFTTSWTIQLDVFLSYAEGT